MGLRLFLLLAVLACCVFAASALAQKPVKEPFEFERLEFAAGEVCPFPMRVEAEGNTMIKTFANGRQMITGTGTTTVTNLATGASTSFRESGSIQVTELSESLLRFDIAGQVSLYFFEQDLPGAGFHKVTGRVTEVLDLEQDAITAVEISGRQTDLCAELAG